MNRSLVRHTLTLAAALVISACGSGDLTLPGSTVLEITPDRATYAAGSNMEFTVRNIGDQPVTYLMCRREYQRLTSLGWSTVVYETPPCLPTFAPLVLAPGATIDGALTLPGELSTGTYRVYFPDFDLSGENLSSADLQTQKSSKPFQVTR
ncbi:MAG TPA: hypothetical protein VFJ82_26855 [Longimicrobium sp.]|nr:hypothetical protein [Longimicrobium sp.]